MNKWERLKEWLKEDDCYEFQWVIEKMEELEQEERQNDTSEQN